MTILVTGFDAHDGGINASRVLVESLRDDPPDELRVLRGVIHFAVMPHSTRQLKAVVLERIARFEPRYCVFTGQAPGRNKITFERVATNLKDFGVADCEGIQPQGEHIEPDGPVSYWSTLPDQAVLAAQLNVRGIPAAMSNHAGNHLCNQILYHALHHAHTHTLDMKCGFVHVPALPVQVQKDLPAVPFMPLDMAREALTLVLVALQGRA